ncbi:MAG: bifunctional metallophosphatase/5'-nucleotidase [Ruminococcaceae bacterium]|nr:bifunctional metallophosphatase/5'-nucleotidase [Oscillospiraceae bacterium]
MKRASAALLLALSLLFSVGCQVIQLTPPLSTQGTQPSAPSADPNCSHADGDNNGICDDCSCSVIVMLDFYAINDLHGKFADSDSQPGVDELTTYLKNARRTDDHVILLSSGDMWQGSSESNLTRGALVTDWMNEMDFAAMTLGNHEFDWGEDYITENLALAEFPFLAINIVSRQTGERVPYCAPSVVVEQGGLQIGIIGAVGDCYSSISPDHTGNISFVVGDALTELVKEEATRLRADGVDYIIYSIHDGYDKTYNNTVTSVYGNQIASYYSVELSRGGYVDLVFEGHTHQRYVLVDPDGVYHLQNGGDNKGISHAEVAYNVANNSSLVTEAEFVSTSVYQNLPDDPIVASLLKKYEGLIAQGDQILGRNARYRDRNALRSLVAELYYQKGLELWGDQYPLVLGGGFLTVRSPGNLPAGEVRYSDLLTLLPFDNQLVLCSIKGADLLSKFFHSTNENYFIAYGSYGESVKNNVDPKATYYLITDTYTSTYRYNNLTEVQRLDQELYARDLLAEYIRQGGLAK